MSYGQEHSDLEALRDEFAELIRREPVCDIDAVFDGPARQRFGRMIASIAKKTRQDAQRASRNH